jgi:hypothetical protein
MKKFNTILGLTLTILLESVGNSKSFDFQKEYAALQSGNYAT